ncbi:MAG: spore maturation protein [Tepidibacter sp.]|uniref:nucleoside recognition domain-containing protein n=1 Tax=Tepidibacter sp. TaxID=2529387 RepID=UPI0025F46B58|nr:nucleoside recognition domain-containing protein [Tepidibacter sp.]MCT4508593.1 spore maturation protein [Tepidibacter sp.]
MNKIWFYMISIGIINSIFMGKLPELNMVIMSEASRGIEFVISLISIMALWMGIMNIAKESGLVDRIGKSLYCVMNKLFPSVPKKSKALSYMIMNMSLNILGASNGATAFGLKAMEELQEINPKKNTATNDMIMFLVINMSSVQLVPFTVLKIRMDEGASNPNEIIITTLIATAVSTIVGIISCKMLQRRY